MFIVRTSNLQELFIHGFFLRLQQRNFSLKKMYIYTKKLNCTIWYIECDDVIKIFLIPDP